MRYAIVALVSVWGVLVRDAHRRSFVPWGRQSDFENTLTAVQRVVDRHAVSWAGDDLHNGYHGPLWYHVAAWLRGEADHEAPARMALLSVGAFALRHVALLVGMRAVYPHARWAVVVAATFHATLPVAVYQDGVAYNESLHAALFTIALFVLCRIERDGPRRISLGLALLFGTCAGLALLTKASAVLLPAAALVLVMAWHFEFRALPTRLRSTVAFAWAAGVSWLLVTGWWCLRNVAAFASPLPHQYDVRMRAVVANHPSLMQAWSERRTLGWFLPLNPRALFHPFGQASPPNFWSEMLASTWVDAINHGFCRLPMRARSFRIWNNPMTDTCIELSRRLVMVGAVLSLLSVVGCVALVVRRSPCDTRRVVIPVTVVLSVALLMVFGARFPFDHHPVIKASYALHVAPFLCASLGLFVSGQRTRLSRVHVVATTLTLGLIACVARWVEAEVSGRTS
jgi:hypothetical protein